MTQAFTTHDSGFYHSWLRLFHSWLKLLPLTTKVFTSQHSDFYCSWLRLYHLLLRLLPLMTQTFTTYDSGFYHSWLKLLPLMTQAFTTHDSGFYHSLTGSYHSWLKLLPLMIHDSGSCHLRSMFQAPTTHDSCFCYSWQRLLKFIDNHEMLFQTHQETTEYARALPASWCRSPSCRTASSTQWSPQSCRSPWTSWLRSRWGRTGGWIELDKGKFELQSTPVLVTISSLLF